MEKEIQDAYLQGNERIKEVIHLFHQEQTEELLLAVCLAIRERIAKDGHFLFPVDIAEDEQGNQTFAFKTLQVNEVAMLAAFTDRDERERAPASGTLSCFMDTVLEQLLQMQDIDGLMINPWGESICLDKEDIAVILNPGVERF